MNDVINRKDAIGAILSVGHIAELSDGDSAIRVSAVNHVLRNLPSAQPKQRWIPCSERMPEEHDWIGTKKFGTTISDEVYVTFENPKGERFCKHLSFQNGKLSAFDKSTIDAFFKGSKPIAWMSLPKAYKEEQG